MNKTANLVRTGVQNSTNEQNYAEANNYLSNAWTMSKGQLIRQMEMMQKELNQLRKENLALKEEACKTLKEITHYQREYLKMLDETEKKKNLDISYLQIAI